MASAPTRQAWLHGGRIAQTTAAVALWHLLLFGGALVSLFPLFWLVSTALKLDGREWLFPPEWIPNPARPENFLDAWRELPALLFLRNSTAVALLATAGNVLAASFVAFGFARLRFVGRDFWFLVLVSTLMLPSVVTLIPTFILFRYLHWFDTLLPLIVPSWLGGGAFNVFLIRQFYATLPMELDEAARVDGASSFWIYWRVLLPLSGPALAAVAIFGFIHHWNDFLGPLVFTNSVETRTLAVGLKLLQSAYGTSWNLIMAGSVWMLLPVLVLFFVAQRYFIRGIALTGMAGR